MSALISPLRGIGLCVVSVLTGSLLSGCPTTSEQKYPPAQRGPVLEEPGTPYKKLSSSPEATAAYIKSLQTSTPGKGIVIFPPVPADKTISADFATSCARWLYLMVGGAPEMTQTPVWTMTYELTRNLGRTDLRLAGQEATKAAGYLGAPYYATGTITKGSIAFQIYDGKGAKVGEPVVLAGTEEQIKTKLPEAANALLSRLGLTAVTASAPQESVAEFTFSGRLPMQPWTNISAQDALELHELSPRSLLASLQYWFTDVLAEPSPEDGNVRTAQILSQGGENPLLLAELSRAASRTASITIDRVAQGGPKNVAIAIANANLYKGMLPDRAIIEAEKSVKLSPNNPDTWQRLSEMFMTYADKIRKGRTIDKITPGEEEQLMGLYAHGEATALHAQSMYPISDRIIQAVALAATFRGDSVQAEKAMEQAFTFAKQRGINQPTANWALQMYHPKWGGSEEKYRQIAKRLLELPIVNLREAEAIMNSMGEELPEEAQKMAKRVETEARKKLQAGTDPTAGEVLYKVLLYQDKDKEAIEAVQQRVALQPNDDEAQSFLVSVYTNNKQLDKAIALCKKVATDNPDIPRYKMQLAELYILQKRFKDGIEPAVAAAKKLPRNYRAQVLAGYLLTQESRYQDALPYLEKTLEISPEDTYAMLSLAEALCHLKQILRAHRYLEKVRASGDKVRSKAAEQLLKEFPA